MEPRRTHDPSSEVMRDELRDRADDRSPEAMRAAQESGWDRTDWAGTASDAPREARDADRWNKGQWEGDQGDNLQQRVDPDLMPEGASSISGRRQTSGEQHWAEPKDDLGTVGMDKPYAGADETREGLHDLGEEPPER